MLVFIVWKNEDGTHYAVGRKNPKAFFNWHNCHLCNPKSAEVSHWELPKFVSPLYKTINEDFIFVEIEDYEYYFNNIKRRLRSVFRH